MSQEPQVVYVQGQPQYVYSQGQPQYVYSQGQPPPQSQVVYAQAAPTVVYAQAVPHSNARFQPGENELFGICRRCRQQFQRPPGVHDGQAEYYRCQNCSGLKTEDIYYSFCAIS